jgi:hypothetical protein
LEKNLSSQLQYYDALAFHMVPQYPGKMSEFHCVIKAISGALGNLSRNCSMFLKSLTVKLGGSWNNIVPDLSAVLKGDILSKNSSKRRHGSFFDIESLDVSNPFVAL